ncbi:hypothetical protein DL771_003327 [Monosporascus sp. 5C6A]|nr:hypothetical protein DL771_003327 [Monosporascus sp. 5C6A]
MNNLLKILTNQSDLKAELSIVRESAKNLQALTRIELDVKRQQILDFFLRINPQPNLDTSIRLRHPGTGEWLTESPGFREWLETAGSKMWLSGIPGAGKTVLAGAIIQQALDRGADLSKVGVAFFFCDYKNAGTSLPENILGAIASQLARQNADAFNTLQQLYESLHPSNGLPKELDADNSRDLIEKMTENFDQVIIVVDGLDECGDNTDDVVGLLSDLAEYTANISMALFSRDEYNINRSLQGSFTKVMIEAHKDDILLYVAAEIDKRIRDGKLRIADMNLKDEIMNKLADKADRM